MKIVRRIMQDRSSAGAVAVLALLLFLLHGLANGVAHGTMAAAAIASNDVICSAHMPTADASRHAPAEKLADSCCGTLCRLASAASAALPLGTLDIPNRFPAHRAFRPWIRHDVAQAPRPNPRSQPRAPPHVSLA